MMCWMKVLKPVVNNKGLRQSPCSTPGSTVIKTEIRCYGRCLEVGIQTFYNIGHDDIQVQIELSYDALRQMRSSGQGE